MRPIVLLSLLAAIHAAVSVDGPSTARGIVGSPFSCQISASGATTLVYGAAPLPAGLSLDPATGRISGTPTAAGSTTVVISASGGSTSASLSLALEVAAAGTTGVPTNAQAVTLTAGSAASFLALASATGGTFAADGLPGGLGITDAGLLWGVPLAAGIYNVDLSCDAGATATTMAVTVLPAQTGAPVVQVLAQPQAAAGARFGCWIDAAGADSFGCANLPTWLALDGISGSISGVPAATDPSVNLLITVGSGPASSTTVMAIPVAVPTSAGQVPDAPALVEGTLGSCIGWTTTTAEATQLSAVNLPPGMSLDPSSGLLVGIPTASGVFNAIITSTPDAPALPVSTTVGMRIRADISGAPVIGDLLPQVLTAGVPAAVAMQSAGPAATAWNLTGSAAYAISSEGLISGTPPAAGTSTVRITASNDVGTTVTTLMLRAAARNAAAPAQTSATILRTTSGSAFASALTADAAVTSWSANGLPATITLSPFTGILTGAVTTPGASSIRVSGEDADGSNPTGMVIVAGAAGPVITAAGPWYLGTGQPARILLSADATASWSVGGLPTGLSATATGTISGTPAAAATANLAIAATAAAVTARTAGLIIVQTTPSGAPVFASADVLRGVVGIPFTASLAASNAPFEYAVANGPAWLSVDGSSGAISGTPVDVGTWMLSVTARNGAGTSRTVMALQVTATAPPPAPTPDPGLSGVSGGGCGAGAAGILLLPVLLLRLRRPRRR